MTEQFEMHETLSRVALDLELETQTEIHKLLLLDIELTIEMQRNIERSMSSFPYLESSIGSLTISTDNLISIEFMQLREHLIEISSEELEHDRLPGFTLQSRVEQVFTDSVADHILIEIEWDKFLSMPIDSI